MPDTSSFIYFDHNATTPIDPRVLEYMYPYFSEQFGNAASITYPLGLNAKNAVDKARKHIANLINCLDQEITFTSGATESMNTAIKGIFWRYQTKGQHFLSLPSEHSAVMDTLEWVKSQGAEVTFLKIDSDGLIDLEDLKNNIRTDTVAVIAMLANNETGVIQPIQQIAEIVHKNNSLLICDATQAVSKTKVDVQDLGIDVLALSAHKMYGPKGVGALYLRRRGPRVSIAPLIHGGGHERGHRSGTLNVPGIIGLGKAAELAPSFINSYQNEVLPIRQFIEAELTQNKIATINAQNASRLANTINAELIDIRAETVIKKVQNRIGISTGSACSASDPKPSHVLLAMGRSEQQAQRTIRISLGVGNTIKEAKVLINLLKEIQ